MIRCALFFRIWRWYVKCFPCSELVHQSRPSIIMLLRWWGRFIRFSRFPVIMNNVIWLLCKISFSTLWCVALFKWISWRLILCNSVSTNRIHVFFFEFISRLKQYRWSMFWRFTIAIISFPPLFVQIWIFWQLFSMNTYSSITKLFQIGLKNFSLPLFFQFS